MRPGPRPCPASQSRPPPLEELRTAPAAAVRTGSPSETHVIVEQIDNRGLGFDPLSNQIDAGTSQKIGEIFRVNIGLCGGNLVEQQFGRHLQEAERTVGQLIGFNVQVRNMIHRKRKPRSASAARLSCSIGPKPR